MKERHVRFRVNQDDRSMLYWRIERCPPDAQGGATFTEAKRELLRELAEHSRNLRRKIADVRYLKATEVGS